MQETRVQFLGQEESLEKEVATHSSIPAWKNPMDRGAWWATVHGVTESVMTEQNVHTCACVHVCVSSPRAAPSPHLSRKPTVHSSLRGERNTPQAGEAVTLISRLARNKLRAVTLSSWAI